MRQWLGKGCGSWCWEVKKRVKLPSTSDPCLQSPANLPSSPGWRTRVLALPQSHLRKEKEPGPGVTGLS